MEILDMLECTVIKMILKKIENIIKKYFVNSVSLRIIEADKEFNKPLSDGRISIGFYWNIIP